MKRRMVLGIGAALVLVAISGGFYVARNASAQSPPTPAGCNDLPNASQLQQLLQDAPNVAGTIGGLFNGTRVWGAVVNRSGEVCSYTTSTAIRSQVWPGSQAIAKAKAYTANAFSLDNLALSTAMLYTFAQPGHSLYGLNQSQPFNPAALGAYGGNRQVVGGIITFGGGVPLYKNGKIIGGLGISGDTASADHEVAKRVRNLASLNPPGGETVDDISYSSVDGASVFTHPLSLNTWRNGVFIGNEKPAEGY